MGGVLGPKNGASGGGSSPAQNSPFFKQNVQKTVTSAGKIAVSIADPSGTIKSSIGNTNNAIIGLGTGLVSIAENLPILGAITKPVIGAVGTIADATIGTGVRALEGVRVDIGGKKNLAEVAALPLDVVGGALEFGLTALGAPVRFVGENVASSRIKEGVSGTRGFASTLFGDAPQAAINSVKAGGSIEDAARQLVKDGKGFSEDGAMNFIYEMLLDPVNFILPGVGKFASIGKEAMILNAMGESKLLGLAKQAAKEGSKDIAEGYLAQAAFLKKWDWAGGIYRATLGQVNGSARRLSSTIVKEVATGALRAYRPRVIDGFLNDVTALGGRELANRGLTNHAATFMNAVKSGAIRAKTAIIGSVARDFSDNVISDIIRLTTEKKTKEQILATAAGREGDNLGKILIELNVPPKIVDDLFTNIAEGLKNNVRGDELRRKLIDQRDQVQSFVANAQVRRQKDLITRISQYKVDLDSRLATEDGIRVISEAKLDRVPAASNPAVGIQELTQDLAAGFGMKEADAANLARSIFAKHKGDIAALTDVLAFARSANLGQAMRELGSLRNLLKGKVLRVGNKDIDLSRITITSSRSITQSDTRKILARIDELKVITRAGGSAADAAKKELDNISDGLVANYDEFGSFAGYGGTHTRDSVFEYLEKIKDRTVRELNEAERTAIVTAAAKDQSLAQIANVEKRLLAMGYRLGLPPKDGLATVRSLVTDHHGRDKMAEVLTPFSDMIDNVGTNLKNTGDFDQAIANESLRPTGLGRIWSSLTREYGSEITKNNIIERFVTDMVSKTGVSVNTSRRIMSRVTSLAAEKGIQPKALFLDKIEVEKIFREEMEDAYGRLADSGTNPIKMIVDAAAGDYAVAGLTSGFTGRVKAIFPEITAITDRLYPEARFGRLNPFFNLVLERSETNIMNIIHNVQKEVAIKGLGDIKGAILRKAHLDPRNVNREINDGMMNRRARAAGNMTAAVEASPTFKARVASRILALKTGGVKAATDGLVTKEGVKSAFSIDGVKAAKEVSRDIMSDQFAAREILDNINRMAPGKLDELASHYGVTSADQVVERLIADYLLQADPIRFAQVVQAEAKMGRTLAEKALKEVGVNADDAMDIAASTIAAYETTLLRASRAADKAQYFSSHRSWLERSLNHPFLGVYPYSYMTQKAIPGLLKLMFKTPIPKKFGKNVIAPGLGYYTWNKVVEEVNDSINSDRGLISDIVTNDALMYLLTTLLPVTPDGMGFNMPAWLRRGVIQPGLSGTDLNAGELSKIPTRLIDQIGQGTILGQSSTLLEGVQSVNDITQANQNITDFIETNLPTAEEIQNAVSGIRGNE
jgi:hypothetical protein